MSKKEIQNNDKKTFIKWLVIILFAGFLGFSGGIIAKAHPEMIDAFLQMLANTNDFLMIPLVVLFLLSTVLGYGYSFFKYRKAKQLVEKGYDDDSYEKAEEELSKASVVSNVLCGFNYLFFGICLFAAGMAENDLSLKQLAFSFVTIILFIIASICNVIMQNKGVNLDKKMNPEKRGNVFDKKFAKEWLASCDEAEKAVIYESAYSAYRVAIGISTGLWGISLIGMLSFHTGVLPIIVTSVMMIVLITTYSVTAYKLQFKK